MAEPKTRPTDVPVADFIAAVDNPRRRADAEVMQVLLTEVTGVAPVMWGPSIVGFGELQYPLAGGKTGTTLKIGFAARKPQLVLYGMGIERRTALLGQLGPHSTGKGCLYIKRLSAIDEKALEAIVSEAWAEG